MGAIHLLQEQSCVCVSHECVCVFHRAFLHVCVPFLSGVLSGYFLSFLEHSYVSECVCVFSSKTIPVCVCVPFLSSMSIVSFLSSMSVPFISSKSNRVCVCLMSVCASFIEHFCMCVCHSSLVCCLAIFCPS